MSRDLTSRHSRESSAPRGARNPSSVPSGADDHSTVTFTFNGRPIEALPQDTVASALYRSGRRIFSRSFKYHRPRGLLCVSGRCPIA